jgi:hypothetical protein
MTFAHLPVLSRNPMIAFIIAASLLLLEAPASADVYKWVNENNEVQYTQMAPPGGIEYVRIRTAERPEVVEAAPKAASSEEEQALKAKQASDAEAKAAYEAEVARISAQNCKIARNNLSQLNTGGHLRFRNEAGEYVTMTEEDRQRRIAEATRQIEQFCKDDAE